MNDVMNCLETYWWVVCIIGANVCPCLNIINNSSPAPRLSPWTSSQCPVTMLSSLGSNLDVTSSRNDPSLADTTRPAPVKQDQLFFCINLLSKPSWAQAKKSKKWFLQSRIQLTGCISISQGLGRSISDHDSKSLWCKPRHAIQKYLLKSKIHFVTQQEMSRI